jgi:hypothetical protein
MPASIRPGRGTPGLSRPGRGTAASIRPGREMPASSRPRRECRFQPDPAGTRGANGRRPGGRPAERATSVGGGRIDPGSVRSDTARMSAPHGLWPGAAHCWPPGPTPPCSLHVPQPTHVAVRERPRRCERRVAAIGHSERCCGIPASRARTSVSRYRRWPPSVRIDVSFPALAHRVTVFGSTRNIVATSAGVSSGSASGVRADIITASPPGPVLRSCVCCSADSSLEPAVDVPYGLLRPYCHHQR